jgi:hypothetical protein
MPNFEMTFMAIASKNSFLTHEEAAEVLAAFNNQTGPRQTIEEIVLAHGMLTADQVRIISQRRQEDPGSVDDGRAGVRARRAPAVDAADSDAAAPSKPNPNEPIPGIRISGKLGVGGTATVFLADDLRANRKVALKIMHPSLAKDEKAVRRFQRESTLLVSFDHPNLVKGYTQGMMGRCRTS